MVQPPQDPAERKRQLALSLDSSRQALTTSGQDLKRRLSPVHAVNSYFRRHPMQVFGATAAGVALLTYLLRRPPREKKPRKSLSRRLLGWGIALAKPAVKAWVLNYAKGYLWVKPPKTETDSLLGP